MPLKLIIELDGSQHHLTEAAARDDERTRYLAQQGFTVLRFQNQEVLKERARVLNVIQCAVEEPSPPEIREADFDPPSWGG